MKKLTPHQRGLRGSDAFVRETFSSTPDFNSKQKGPNGPTVGPTVAERLSLRVASLERMHTMVAPMFPQSELLEEINMSLDVMRELVEFQRRKDQKAGKAEEWPANFYSNDDEED